MIDLTEKRILITGAHGFLGRHLTAQLEMLSCRDIVAPTRKDFDLTDHKDVRSMFLEVKPQIVFHLAAVVGGIGANRGRPAEFLTANALMGLHMLQEARISGCQKLIMVGTVCAYPKHCPVPFRETDLWNGYPEETNAPYGVAKRMLLVAAQAYRRQYGLNTIYLIPVNLYGPGDNFDPGSSHVVPALIRKFAEAKEAGTPHVVLWGTGRATREFLYVGDAARALALAAGSYDGSDPVNIGTGRDISIADLAGKIAKMMDFTGSIVWDHSMPDGQPERRLEITKARSEFGFEATTSLDQGLKETLRWYLGDAAAAPGPCG